MLETKDLILDKAKYSDYQKMYYNVWSHEEITRYTVWNISPTLEAAKERILKTIEFQKNHDMFFVYDKKTGDPIGFAGIEKVDDSIYEEAGICLGPNFVGKGYGKQILKCLIDYAKNEFGAKEFIYTAHEDNIASNALAKSFGFTELMKELKKDEKGRSFKRIKYSLKL